METFYALKVWTNCQRVDQPLALCRGLSATSRKVVGGNYFYWIHYQNGPAKTIIVLIMSTPTLIPRAN